MGRNSREEIFDRRMKTNIYDDTSLEEIRGRIRRIDGHRTSSLSDIKNFQTNIDVSALKIKDNSTILISENTLLELKSKVDESETQKHFMNALKERLKETTHEKELLLKKSQADKETIRKNHEEIELLKEEIARLNGNISELKDLLENSKQRIAELESCNDGNNIMTEVDMQSRIESMVDCKFRNKEVKTLQDELLFNNNEFSSNSSDASSKVTVRSNIRHVLFNDKTEKFVGDLKVGTNHLRRTVNDSEDIYGKSVQNFNDEIHDYDCGNSVISNSHKIQVGNKHDWMRMMVRLNGFIYFKSKMMLIKQYLMDEEIQLLEEVNLESNSNGNGNKNVNTSITNSSNSKIGKKSNNIGYSGPSENKIKMIFSPLKTEVNEIIYRLEKDGEEDEEHIYTEKKNLLSKLDEQISILKEKIEIAGSASSRTSISSSRVMSFSDITTEKDSMDSIQVINSSRSSRFSDKIKSSFDHVFMINKRLLFTLVRLKLWIVEEILYDEQVLDGSISSREYNHDPSRYLLNYFESACEFIINLEDNRSYSLNNNEYLSIGMIQMLYILNKQWERSINNENRLLNQLQEMVRIYHRLKNYLLAFPKNGYQQNSKESEREYNAIQGSEIESLHLSNENNYVFQVEKELTSLGLGIFSGRDLNSGNNGNRNVNGNKFDSVSDNLLALNSKDGANSYEMNGNMDGLLSREQVNEILRHLENSPDPYIANRNEILSIRELIRPLKSYGRRAPEPYIGFFAMMTQRLDNDIVQHDREIRAFQKVIKGLEDQCDRQQEELEELHEELEQLYEIIETKYDEPSEMVEQGETDKGETEGDKKQENGSSKVDNTDSKEKSERRLTSQISDKEWISLCKQTSLGLSDDTK
ncbi:uncharacterized protein ELE39_002268 [Cryptosporidium sp. chipmunk genotype I]|uniref:uncharacterized protein n=1 Tax=Cryptosporidium sp. chipmunk genotype I TaxID=1280935 RepID=UPI00351A47C8|nr:hypothetical protein ELE39_002268 [Cryptosporidium sp. chipmunk genotype I]